MPLIYRPFKKQPKPKPSPLQQIAVSSPPPPPSQEKEGSGLREQLAKMKFRKTAKATDKVKHDIPAKLKKFVELKI